MLVAALSASGLHPEGLSGQDAATLADLQATNEAVTRQRSLEDEPESASDADAATGDLAAVSGPSGAHGAVESIMHPASSGTTRPSLMHGGPLEQVDSPASGSGGSSPEAAALTTGTTRKRRREELVIAAPQ